MRSIHVSMLALALTTLLCACVSRVPVWETVDDEFVCQQPRHPSTIVFAVPDGAISDVFSPDGLSRQYTAPDGSYELYLTEDAIQLTHGATRFVFAYSDESGKSEGRAFYQSVESALAGNKTSDAKT